MKCKFDGGRAGFRDLAHCLDTILPVIDESSLAVCGVPTTSSHIRQRGYDHTQLLARHVAGLRGWQYAALLRRTNHSHQIGATRRQRYRQAATAFTAATPTNVPDTVLLVDDVITTGATVEAAARCLKTAGVTRVLVAAVAFEPLKR